MKKLPHTRNNLPARPGKTAVVEKKDFKSTMATLRKLSGKPEHVLIPMCCAVHDRPYVIVYRRIDPLKQFQIEKIIKETSNGIAQDKGLIARHLGGNKNATHVYDHEAFDTTGRSCPWCHDKGNVVHCGDCGETYCSGSTKRSANGPAFYRCVARCGSSGVLTDYDKMHGNKGKAIKNRAKQGLLSSGSKPALLEKPDLLRLPKK